MNYKFAKELLLSIFLFLPIIGYTQINFESIKTSYLYEVSSNHGLNIGAQIQLRSWTKKKKGHKERTWFLTPQISSYNHTQNFVAILYNAELGFRLNKLNKKWYNQYGISIGAITQFNTGLTYIWEGDELTTSRTGSRSYVHSNLSHEIGRRINPRLEIFAKANIGIQFPYNTYFTMTSYLQIGLNFNLKRNKIWIGHH